MPCHAPAPASRARGSAPMAAPTPSLEAGVLLAGPSHVPSGYRHPCCEGLISWPLGSRAGERGWGCGSPGVWAGGSVGTRGPPAAQSSTHVPPAPGPGVPARRCPRVRACSPGARAPGSTPLPVTQNCVSGHLSELTVPAAQRAVTAPPWGCREAAAEAPSCRRVTLAPGVCSRGTQGRRTSRIKGKTTSKST